MEVSQSYKPQTLLNQTLRPEIQQYQFNNQQNNSPLTHKLINTIIGTPYLNSSFTNQEFSRFDQNNTFSVNYSQDSVSRKQYLRIVQQNQSLKQMNDELNTKIEQLRKSSKNPSQCTQDEQRKKQQDAEDENFTTPQKIQLIKPNQVCDKMTVKIRKQLSELEDGPVIKQLEYYKMKLKDQQQKLQTYQKKIRQYKQMYDKSQTNLQKLQKNNYNLKEQVDIITAENGRFEYVVFGYKDDIRQLQQKIADFQKQKEFQLENLRQQINIWKAKVHSLQEQIRPKNIQKQKISQELQTLRTQYRNKIVQKEQLIQKQIIQQRKTKKIFEDKISQKQKQIIRIDQSNKKLQTEKKALEAKIKNLESTFSKLQQQGNKLKSQKETLKTKVDTLVKQKQALNNKNSTLEQEIKKQKESNQKIRRQKQTEKMQSQRQINDLKNRLMKTQQMLAEKQKQQSRNIRQKEDQIMHMMRQNGQIMQKVQNCRSILKPLYDVTGLNFDQNNLGQGTSNVLINKVIRGSYFQQSNILNTVDPRKTYFLYRQLTTFLQTPTIKSQMLFKFDPINPKNNYFNYIAGIKNVMLLVKLKNGTMVGGFTVFPFVVEVERPGKGFIFSLSAEKSFKMKKQPKVAVTTNDPFFLIIGSSQLRLKYNQLKFFSNFGVAASTFESNGFSKQEFLGIKQQNVSQVDFQTYEIYAIHAEQ